MRLLILLGIIYLVYRALKSYFKSSGLFQNTSSQKPVSGSDKIAGEIDDVMIKDPYCEVYFPKRNGVHLKVDGKDLYFCSKKCKDKYLALPH